MVVVVNTHPIKLIKFLFYLLVISFFIQSSSYAIKYKVTEKEYIERCYDWDIYRTSFCPFPVELKHLCDDCRYDGEGKNQKDGNIIPNGSGNFSNIVIESFIPPNPNPSSEDDFDFQIFVTETLCIAEGTCHRYVRPRVPIISVADIEPEPDVKTNNRNDRTRYGFNFISFEPLSQNWNFNNNYISYALTREGSSQELNRIHHGIYEGQRMEVVDIKKDVFDDEGNLIGFNIETHRADPTKSTATFVINTEAGNAFTFTFNYDDLGQQGRQSTFVMDLFTGLVDKKEWSEEFLDGSPAASVQLVKRNVVKGRLLETNFHEIQNPVNQETVKVGEVETVKEVEIKVEKKDVKVPQNLNEVLISMGAPSAKQKEFIIDKDLFYPAKIATDALILNYNGEFKNGVPHGNGTVTILNPKTNLKYGLYGDYKINLSGTFKYGVFKKLNEIYYPISGEVFKFTKGVNPYESEFTRNILHGACLGKCKKIKISLDNINLGKPSKKYKNMPAISTKLISQTQLFKNNTPTILSTHATIEMEDDKGNILPTLGINLPPLATKSLFTLPGYNDFASPNYININDSKKVKELKLNILNLKRNDLEGRVQYLLQDSEIKDRKELIKKAKKISKKYKIPPSEFLQKDVFEHISNDKAHKNQPMTADYSNLIEKLDDAPGTLKLSIVNFIKKDDPDPIAIDDNFTNTRFIRGGKTLSIESKTKKHEVDSDFLKKSQSGNAEKLSTMESFEFDTAFQGWNSLALKADNDTESYYNLIGGNAVVNAFGVAGYAQQVIDFLNSSKYYGNSEFLKTNDINYILKSMIETNLPNNSSLDLDDEYIKTIFEKSDLEKLVLLLEFYLENLLDDRDLLFYELFFVADQCKKSPICNFSIDWDYGGFGYNSDNMKKIIRVVEASKSKKDDSGDDGGGDDGW